MNTISVDLFHPSTSNLINDIIPHKGQTTDFGIYMLKQDDHHQPLNNVVTYAL